jgi:hypothetical protein
MKSKSFFVILAVLAVFVLTVCPSTAFAQPNPQLWGPTNCIPISPLNNAETFALGNIQSNAMTADEGNDFLALYTPVFPALCKMDVTYTTTFPHSVQSIAFHMGSSADVAEEWAFFVDVIFPVPFARTIKLPIQQYDKHWANGPGSQNSELTMNLEMPVGTVIRIRRPYVVCLGIPDQGVVNPFYPNNYGPYDQGNCITGQAVTFVGR